MASADTIKEVMDFAFRFDTKQATDSLRKMERSFAGLRDTGKRVLKDSATNFKEVAGEIEASNRNLKDLRGAYERLKRVSSDYAAAAVAGYASVDESVTDLIKMQEDYADLLYKAEATEKKIAQTREKLNEKRVAQEEAVHRAIEEGTESSIAAADKATEAWAAEVKSLKDLEGSLNRVNAALKRKGGFVASQSKAVSGKVSALSDVTAGAGRAADRIMERNRSAASAVEQFRDGLSDYGWSSAGEDIAEGIADGLNALKGKDPLGLIKSLGRVALKPAAMGAGRGIQSMAMSGSGGKAMEMMSGSMGKLVGTFSKFGPLLSAVGGAVVGFVKLIIDANAAAVEWNREFLTGVGTADMFNAANSRAAVATENLDKALRQARDSAHDFMLNNKLGVTAKDHAAYLQTLQAEGVQLNKLAAAGQKAHMQVGDFNQELVATGVVYSRMFGVSMQEISQLQGQLMTETGMSAKSVQTSFSQVLMSAKDSGMAASKFFGIIRSMSAEMTLFNFRMEEAAQVLKAVGKAMSAQNAQKFLQGISQFYKGMGLEDRIKHTLMGGQGATQKDMKASVASKIQSLSVDFQSATGGDPEALKKAIEGTPKELHKFLAQFGDKLPAGMADSIIDAQRTSKQASGGLVGVAASMRNADPGTVMKQLNRISQEMVGSKLSEAKEINYLAITKLTGLTEEQIDGFAKMEASLGIMREQLSARAKTGQLTADDMKQLQKAGISDADKMTPDQLEKAIQSLDDTTFFNSLAVSQQEAVQGVKQQRDFALEQTNHLQSIEGKIQNLLDWMMNKFYGLVLDIKDVLVNMFGSSEDKKKLAEQKILESTPGLRKYGSLKEAEGDIRKTAAAGYASMGSRYEQTQSAQMMADKLTPEQWEKAIRASVKDSGDADNILKQSSGMFGSRTGVLGSNFGSSIDFSKFFEVAVSGMSASDLVTTKGFGLGSKLAATTPAAGGGQPAASAAATTPPPGSSSSSAAAAPSPPGGGLPFLPVTSVQAEEQKEAIVDQTAKQEEAAAKQEEAAKKLHKVVKQEGIKLDKMTIDGPMKSATESATLEAFRKALFEQYLYKDVPIDDMIKGIQSGAISSSGPGSLVYSSVSESGKAFDPTVLTPNAEGGVVVRPPAGEYIAAVAPGERIVPAASGGGGNSTGPVSITVNGDAPANFKAHMEKTVRRGIDEYRKMQQSGY